MVDKFSGAVDPPFDQARGLKTEGLGVLAVTLLAVTIALGTALGGQHRRRFTAELAAIAADWERLAPGDVLAIAARRLIRPALAVLDP